jgi:hypothetical protein
MPHRKGPNCHDGSSALLFEIAEAVTGDWNDRCA